MCIREPNLRLGRDIHLHSSSPRQTNQTHNQTITTTKMPTERQVAGGHKANLNNPNTSDASKQHSREVLDNEFNGGDGECRAHQRHMESIEMTPVLTYPPVPGANDNQNKNPNNVAGGLKA
ncbi:hypothetical protein B0T22DRAFT_473307 [Podospora appendiculata]|uniref:Uncharacterized protein n=1 Tax=Podospora appendiculata TaxID=314037 RepID=A0AAE0WZB5_9PEZI|nr:hypothetical protein B0T22DRAFT_473307 [Podospora appendiculata]